MTDLLDRGRELARADARAIFGAADARAIFGVSGGDAGARREFV